MAAHSFSVEWSEADGEFVGLVDTYPSLSWLDKNPMVALQGIKDATADVDEDMRIEEQAALEYGYQKLAREQCTADIERVRRQRGMLAAQSVYRAQQEQIEQALQSEDPAEDFSWVEFEPVTGAHNWAGVHGALSKRFGRQDFWVFVGCAVVLAWILLGPVF